MIRKLFFITASAGLLFLALPPAAHASEIDKLTLLTFNHPVALPDVALAPGTYRFELADPTGDQSLVRVMSADGTMSYGTFITIPDTHAPANHKAVTLEKQPAGTPETITAWFYPGDGVGHEFMYPQDQAKG
jgi:hypothetical protein